PVSDKRQPYLERFIHAAIFEARPDIVAVVHAHAEDTLPCGIVAKPREPVIHSGSFIGGKVPVWDIRKKFGDTDLLVRNMAQGRDLAKCMAGGSVALMRGHGFASAARSIIEVVRLSVYLPRNARVQMNAIRMGGKPKPLSKGEIAARAAGYKPHSPETWRAWQYWATRAGCADMIGEAQHHAPKKKGNFFIDLCGSSAAAFLPFNQDVWQAVDASFASAWPLLSRRRISNDFEMLN